MFWGLGFRVRGLGLRVQGYGVQREREIWMKGRKCFWMKPFFGRKCFLMKPFWDEFFLLGWKCVLNLSKHLVKQSRLQVSSSESCDGIFPKLPVKEIGVSKRFRSSSAQFSDLSCGCGIPCEWTHWISSEWEWPFLLVVGGSKQNCKKIERNENNRKGKNKKKKQEFHWMEFKIQILIPMNTILKVSSPSPNFKRSRKRRE